MGGAENLGEGEVLALDCLDGAFSQRMPAEEWAQVKAFRSRPTFLDALHTYAELLMPYYSDQLLLNKVVSEGKRFEMLVYLLFLHATRDPNDTLSGLTSANFQRVCVQQNVSSAGRAVAILSVMRLARFLQKERGLDSRVTRLAPTPRFAAIVEGWNQNVLRIVDAATPEAELAAFHAAHREMGVNMRTRCARQLLAGWHVLPPFPEARSWIDRDGGWMLLLHCTHQALQTGQRKTIAPVSVNLADFGKRFGVSRSHLRRLLEEAYAQGQLTAPPKNGANIRLSQGLVASYLTCMAMELSNTMAWAHAARADVQAASPQSSP